MVVHLLRRAREGGLAWPGRGGSRPARPCQATAVVGPPARAGAGWPARTHCTEQEAAAPACSQQHAKGRGSGCCGGYSVGRRVAGDAAVMPYRVAMVGNEEEDVIYG